MRASKPYVQIDPDVLEQARQIDLLSYLRAYEPSNLVKVKGTTNVYCTAEHDSLKISNGKWYWWSRGFGGYSALDYLMKVKEYGFVEAVETLTGQTISHGQRPTTAAIPMQMRWSFPQCRHSGSVGRSTATHSIPPMYYATTHTGGRLQAEETKPL